MIQAQGGGEGADRWSTWWSEGDSITGTGGGGEEGRQTDGLCGGVRGTVLQGQRGEGGGQRYRDRVRGEADRWSTWWSEGDSVTGTEGGEEGAGLRTRDECCGWVLGN